jgi:hypothetical protein
VGPGKGARQAPPVRRVFSPQEAFKGLQLAPWHKTWPCRFSPKTQPANQLPTHSLRRIAGLALGAASLHPNAKPRHEE